MGRGTSSGEAPKLYARDLRKKHGARHRGDVAKRKKYSSNLSKQSEQRLKEYRAWEKQQRKSTNPANG